MKIIFSDDPPGFIAGAPFGYYDVDIIRDELVRGGFSQFSIATLEETSSAPTPRHAAVALCQGVPLRTEIDSRDAGRLDHVTDRVTEAIAVRFGGGPVSGEMRAHIVVAA